jgi:hypothetical protein
MKCPGCGSDNREGAKFCGECAAPLAAALACPRCGTANPKVGSSVIRVDSRWLSRQLSIPALRRRLISTGHLEAEFARALPKSRPRT